MKAIPILWGTVLTDWKGGWLYKVCATAVLEAFLHCWEEGIDLPCRCTVVSLGLTLGQRWEAEHLFPTYQPQGLEAMRSGCQAGLPGCNLFITTLVFSSCLYLAPSRTQGAPSGSSSHCSHSSAFHLTLVLHGITGFLCLIVYCCLPRNVSSMRAVTLLHLLTITLLLNYDSSGPIIGIHSDTRCYIILLMALPSHFRMWSGFTVIKQNYLFGLTELVLSSPFFFFFYGKCYWLVIYLLSPFLYLTPHLRFPHAYKRAHTGTHTFIWREIYKDWEYKTSKFYWCKVIKWPWFYTWSPRV